MFPAEKLVASGGRIFAHLFENPRMGVPRDVYWSVTIDFHPIEYEDKQWQCAMTCEWLTWPLRDWRNLTGQSLDLNYGDQGSESSFYMWQHDKGKSTRLRIGPRTGNCFDVAMDMVVDFAGCTATDRNPALEVRGHAAVPYTGVIVVPENLFPKPNTPAEVTSVVSSYLDTSLYAAPERDGHAFRMQPLQGL